MVGECADLQATVGCHMCRRGAFEAACDLVSEYHVPSFPSLFLIFVGVVTEHMGMPGLASCLQVKGHVSVH